MGDARNYVAFHDRADIAGPKLVLGDVAGQDHVAVLSKGMIYLDKWE